MSAYIKLATLEYPRHEGDIRLDHPEILESQTGDTFPCPETYALVVPTQRLTFNPATSKCIESAPVQTDGVWQMTLVVVPLTQEELDFNAQQEASLNFLNNPGSVPDVID
tara:strand:- start:1113 stop:1442 length:330 start_codon:yes stop_codon:yes gene_type:complete